MVHHLVTSLSSRQKIFPITGIWGCGKTRLVSYFLREHSSLWVQYVNSQTLLTKFSYRHVVFVDATSSASIKSDFQTWSRTLGDDHEQDVWEDGLRILSKTPQDKRLILVFDNADDPDLELSPLIPQNDTTTIIITSRKCNIGDLSTTFHLELGEMEADEALTTLLHAARRERPLSAIEMEKAHALAKELGYLAVALVQAGTYCYQLSSHQRGVLSPFTFTQSLSLFQKQRPELMREGLASPLDHYKRGVYTTLDLSYRAIPQPAQDFLHYIAFFHCTDIRLSVMAAAGSNFTEEGSLLPWDEDHTYIISHLGELVCRDGEWSEQLVQKKICDLCSFSLISVTSVGDSLSLQLHPLVQAWFQDTLPSSQYYRAMAMQTITSCCRGDNIVLYQHLLPHILHILGQVEAQNMHVNNLQAIGKVLCNLGHYGTAAKLLETALGKMKGLDQSIEKLAQIMSSLANAYWKEAK